MFPVCWLCVCADALRWLLTWLGCHMASAQEHARQAAAALGGKCHISRCQVFLNFSTWTWEMFYRGEGAGIFQFRFLRQDIWIYFLPKKDKNLGSVSSASSCCCRNDYSPDSYRCIIPLPPTPTHSHGDPDHFHLPPCFILEICAHAALMD